MKRKDIEADIAAKVLFQSDRTCCVCRTKGKPVQIHHIDGNNSNNSIENLCVLCFDCHTDTQVTGGFHRKLDAEQIILYRDDWVLEVSRRRTAFLDKTLKAEESDKIDIELATSYIEILRENEQFELVAMQYHVIGNAELRDKYIELALKKRHSPETEIYLRHIQRKIEKIKKSTINKAIERKVKNHDWSQLARLYKYIGNIEKAIESYCKTICESLNEGNTFSAAFYLKELNELELYNELFEKAFKKYNEEGDLWWQVKSLQELGWYSELENLILSKRKEIEELGDLHLLSMLYKITGEKEQVVKINKKIAESTGYGAVEED